MPLADVDEIENDSSEFEHQHKRDFAGNNDDLTWSLALRTSGIS
jgi:hypothetical protein